MLLRLAAASFTAGLALVVQFAVCRVAVGSYYWALMIAAVWKLPAPRPGKTAGSALASQPAAQYNFPASWYYYNIVKMQSALWVCASPPQVVCFCTGLVAFVSGKCLN
jgi:hypothetical protein